MCLQMKKDVQNPKATMTSNDLCTIKQKHTPCSANELKTMRCDD
jgi:hypothetical protein